MVTKYMSSNMLSHIFQNNLCLSTKQTRNFAFPRKLLSQSKNIWDILSYQWFISMSWYCKAELLIECHNSTFPKSFHSQVQASPCTNVPIHCPIYPSSVSESHKQSGNTKLYSIYCTKWAFHNVHWYYSTTIPGQLLVDIFWSCITLLWNLLWDLFTSAAFWNPLVSLPAKPLPPPTLPTALTHCSLYKLHSVFLPLLLIFRRVFQVSQKSQDACKPAGEYLFSSP